MLKKGESRVTYLIDRDRETTERDNTTHAQISSAALHALISTFKV